VDDVVVGLEPPRRMEVKPVLLTELTTVDAVLRAHAVAVGRDFAAYRNHVYHVVNLCMAQRRLRRRDDPTGASVVKWTTERPRRHVECA